MASLTASGIGLSGCMALTFFVFFHTRPNPASSVFWFLMQIGIIAGFFASLPVNFLLIRARYKGNNVSVRPSDGPAVRQGMNDLERVCPVIGSGRAYPAAASAASRLS